MHDLQKHHLKNAVAFGLPLNDSSPGRCDREAIA